MAHTILYQAVIGILTGGLYGLVAIGFVVIYKSTQVVNFAHGQLMMVAAFIFYALLSQLLLPIWLALPLFLVAVMILGLAIERSLIRPMIGQPTMSIVMMTIGLSSLLSAITVLIWGSGSRQYPEAYSKFMGSTPITLGTIRLPADLLTGFILALIAFAGFQFFFYRTRTGLSMRVTCEGHMTAQSVGIGVRKVFSLVWVIGSLFAGLGGIIVGSINGMDMGMANIGLIAIPAALVGGLESVPGALIGGIIIGLSESVVAPYIDTYVGGGSRQIVPYVVLVIILIFRPYGLFGLKKIERV